MRRTLALAVALIGACDPTARSRQGTDAALTGDSNAQTTDSTSVPRARLATSAIAGDSYVAWSEIATRGSSETGGDTSLGQTALISGVGTASPQVMITSMAGATKLVGDTGQFFTITDDSTGRLELDRASATGNSFTTTRVAGGAERGPALDADFVYWFGTTSVDAVGAIYKTPRDSSGLDPIAVVPGVATPRDLVVTAQYVWWVTDDTVSTLFRSAKDAAAPVPLLDQVAILVAHADSVIVGRFVDNGGVFEAEVGELDAAGVYHALAEHLPQNHGAKYIAVDGDDLVWFALDRNIYRMSLATGGPPTVVPVPGLPPQESGVIALVPGSILFDFAASGFRSLSR